MPGVEVDLFGAFDELPGEGGVVDEVAGAFEQREVLRAAVVDDAHTRMISKLSHHLGVGTRLRPQRPHVCEMGEVCCGDHVAKERFGIAQGAVAAERLPQHELRIDRLGEGCAKCSGPAFAADPAAHL